MSPTPSMSPTLIVVGLLTVLLGAVVWTGTLSWFGHLPGDILVERPGMRSFMPITSMIIVSAALSGLTWLYRWVST